MVTFVVNSGSQPFSSPRRRRNFLSPCPDFPALGRFALSALTPLQSTLADLHENTRLYLLWNEHLRKMGGVGCPPKISPLSLFRALARPASCGTAILGCALAKESHPERRNRYRIELKEKESYAVISPGYLRASLSNPGNTGFKSPTPMCLERISPSTYRKSIVNARSRPSFNWWSASPGHFP